MVYELGFSNFLFFLIFLFLDLCHENGACIVIINLFLHFGSFVQPIKIDKLVSIIWTSGVVVKSLFLDLHGNTIQVETFASSWIMSTSFIWVSNLVLPLRLVYFGKSTYRMVLMIAHSLATSCMLAQLGLIRVLRVPILTLILETIISVEINGMSASTY